MPIDPAFQGLHADYERLRTENSALKADADTLRSQRRAELATAAQSAGIAAYAVDDAVDLALGRMKPGEKAEAWFQRFASERPHLRGEAATQAAEDPQARMVRVLREALGAKPAGTRPAQQVSGRSSAQDTLRAAVEMLAGGKGGPK